MSRFVLRGAMAGGLLLFIAAILSAQTSGNSAIFVGTDTGTQGNWSSKYGADGYFLPTIQASQPSYVSSFSPENTATWVWAASTSDLRAPQTPGGGAAATTWYNAQTFTFDISLAPGQAHQIALYAVDWDSQGRSETVQVVNGDTNLTLDTRSISNFVSGTYLVWSISGHVKINVMRAAWPNGVVSGLFFGAANNTIRVPADQPTIQAAINAAVNGQTVLVAPGTYNENINFSGKAITVTSSEGPDATIIDGTQQGPVVTFSSGEGTSSVLNGFTVQNGLTTFASIYEGGGVFVKYSSPSITANKIINNRGCDGIGIGVYFGSPVIKGTVVDHNSTANCIGGDGGGISIGGNSSAQILNNTITNNTLTSGEGGGIWLDAA